MIGDDYQLMKRVDRLLDILDQFLVEYSRRTPEPNPAMSPQSQRISNRTVERVPANAKRRTEA